MYTYAFLKSPSQVLELPYGIASKTQVVGTQQLAAIVEPDLSQSDLSRLQENDNVLMQAVLDHDRVIRSIFQQTTILPLRFGTHFSSLQGLLTHLETYSQRYLEKLDQFSGKAEYQLKLSPVDLQPGSISPEAKGKAYFLAKKKVYQAQLNQQTQQQRELETIIQQVRAGCTQKIISQIRADGEKVYLLIDRQYESLLLEQLRLWQAAVSHWRLELGEALPPYHFLEG